MKQLKHSKESTVVQRESQRGKPLHKRLRFALVVFVCLFSRHLSNTLNQMTEIVGTTNPSLPPGRLSFLMNLKRTGSTAPGIYVYNKYDPSSAGSQTLKFFDSEPSPDFVHQYELPISLGGLIGRIGYNPQNKVLVCKWISSNPTSTVSYGAQFSYDTGTQQFAISNTFPSSANT